MRKFPNYVKNALVQDNSLNTSIIESIFEIVTQAQGECVTYQNEAKKRKAVVLKDTHSNADYYLFYLNDGLLSVYHDKDRDWQQRPFSYAYNSMKKDDGEIYLSDFILSAYQSSKNKVKKNTPQKNDISDMDFMDILKYLKKVTSEKAEAISDDVKDMLLQALNKEKSNGLQEVNVYPSDVKKFTDFLHNHGYLDEAIKEQFYLQIGYDYVNEANDKVADILVKLDYLAKQGKSHSFNSKNKLVFNDLDNHFWVQNGLVCFDGQNLGYVAQKQTSAHSKNENDSWIIYNYSDPGYRRFEKASEVIKAIKNDDINQLSDVAMIIENGKVMYQNSGDLDILMFQLLHTVNIVQEETGENAQYDVDLYSYEYQAAWHQVQYKMNELKFLIQATLTLGGGFDYDPERGIFYSDDVTYDAQAAKLAKIYHQQERPVAIQTINYCDDYYLADVDKLDNSWKNGMKWMFDMLKTHQPDVIASHDAKKDIAQALKSGEKMFKRIEGSGETNDNAKDVQKKKKMK